jgi:hypothetical protein
VSLLNVRQKEQLIAFLDTKIKTSEEDPEKKWITTWNHYLAHIKYFFRWLHNHRSNNIQAISEETLQQSEWQTPLFAQIKKKKTKRLSPYSDIELWDWDEILILYAISYFWDIVSIESLSLLFLLGLLGLAIGFVGGLVGLVLGVLRFPLILTTETSAAVTAGTNIGISTLASLTAAIRHFRQKFLGSLLTRFVSVTVLLSVILSGMRTN